MKLEDYTKELKPQFPDHATFLEDKIFDFRQLLPYLMHSLGPSSNVEVLLIRRVQNEDILLLEECHHMV